MKRSAGVLHLHHPELIREPPFTKGRRSIKTGPAEALAKITGNITEPSGFNDMQPPEARAVDLYPNSTYIAPIPAWNQDDMDAWASDVQERFNTFFRQNTYVILACSQPMSKASGGSTESYASTPKGCPLSTTPGTYK